MLGPLPGAAGGPLGFDGEPCDGGGPPKPPPGGPVALGGKGGMPTPGGPPPGGNGGGPIKPIQESDIMINAQCRY